MGYANYSRQDFSRIGKIHEDFFHGVKNCLDKKLKEINAAHNTSYEYMTIKENDN